MTDFRGSGDGRVTASGICQALMDGEPHNRDEAVVPLRARGDDRAPLGYPTRARDAEI